MNPKEVLEYNVMYNIGKAKYVINYYTGEKHKDGSKFFGIDIFKNKKDFEKCLNELKGGFKRIEYKQSGKDPIQGTLKRTNKIIFGSNGSNGGNGVIKRRLYIDGKEHLYAKYFGTWWSHTNGEIEHYGIKEEKSFIGVSFYNLEEIKDNKWLNQKFQELKI